MLFLDDDPVRAQSFLKDHPDAVWVQTVKECIARLSESWDEIHLDHDLGGEQFVDLSRDDCGMEVVRWICNNSLPHLKETRFLVHSHNLQAATVMGLQMLANGFKVDVRPFGTAPAEVPPAEIGEEPDPFLGPVQAFIQAVLRFFGRGSRKHSYGYDEYRRGGPPPQPAEPLDLSWAKKTEFRRSSPGKSETPEKIDLGWAAPKIDQSSPRPSPPSPPSEPPS